MSWFLFQPSRELPLLKHYRIPPNIDAALYIAMDKYAMFAITCPHKILDKYIEIITSENKNWQSSHEEGNLYIQQLNPLDYSIRLPEYELVVLQPHHFLPDKSLVPLYSRQQEGQVEGVTQYKWLPTTYFVKTWDFPPLSNFLHSLSSARGFNWDML